MAKLKVLDIYSGTGGWSEAFRQRGHHVARYDNDPQFSSVPDTVIADVLTTFVGGPGDFDVILASPPCQSFSISSIRHHWRAEAPCRCGGRLVRLRGEEWGHIDPVDGTCKRAVATEKPVLYPVSTSAHIGQALLERALEVIRQINPPFWWLENPRGGMRRMPQLQEFDRCTVWYCRYGHHVAKPTDLWGAWPDGWTPRPECHNGNEDHERAPRGWKAKQALKAAGLSNIGTQGLKNPAERGRIPYELSLEVCLSVERVMEATR